MKRVLVITPDRLGPRRAGMGLRHLGIARALAARGYEVTLASTDPESTAPDPQLHFAVIDRDAPHPAFSNLSACIVQGTVLRTLPRLAQLDAPLVVDLICPFFLENLERYRGRLDHDVRLQGDLEIFDEALRLGDHFICGSDRQRHFWLGMLAALGRLDAAATEGDAAARRLVCVVPFGVPQTQPVKRKPVLRGVVPGIGADDLVLCWAGGLWSWLDPLTPIRAVAGLAPHRPEVKLVFAGTRHPQSDAHGADMGARARALATELGVLGRQVFLLDDWVPAAEFDDYLLESDLGVIAHPESLETTFAVRTRFFSYLHARLPVVVTDGDWVAEQVRQHALGRVVPVDDAGAMATAIDALADATARRAAASGADRLARELSWENAVAPLAELVADAAGRPLRRRPVRRSARLAPTPDPQWPVARWPGHGRRVLSWPVTNWRKFRATLASDGLSVALEKSWNKLRVL